MDTIAHVSFLMTKLISGTNSTCSTIINQMHEYVYTYNTQIFEVLMIKRIYNVYEVMQIFTTCIPLPIRNMFIWSFCNMIRRIKRATSKYHLDWIDNRTREKKRDRGLPRRVLKELFHAEKLIFDCLRCRVQTIAVMSNWSLVEYKW